MLVGFEIEAASWFSSIRLGIGSEDFLNKENDAMFMKIVGVISVVVAVATLVLSYFSYLSSSSSELENRNLISNTSINQSQVIQN